MEGLGGCYGDLFIYSVFRLGANLFFVNYSQFVCLETVAEVYHSLTVLQ
jgi:hypothetical protein